MQGIDSAGGETEKRTGIKAQPRCSYLCVTAGWTSLSILLSYQLRRSRLPRLTTDKQILTTATLLMAKSA